MGLIKIGILHFVFSFLLFAFSLLRLHGFEIWRSEVRRTYAKLTHGKQATEIGRKNALSTRKN